MCSYIQTKSSWFQRHAVQQPLGQDTAGLSPAQSAVNVANAPLERNSQISAGISPVRSVPCNSRLANCVSSPSSLGIAPENEFLCN